MMRTHVVLAQRTEQIMSLSSARPHAPFFFFQGAKTGPLDERMCSPTPLPRAPYSAPGILITISVALFGSMG
jgi:hypothetical protein